MTGYLCAIFGGKCLWRSEYRDHHFVYFLVPIYDPPIMYRVRIDFTQLFTFEYPVRNGYRIRSRKPDDGNCALTLWRSRGDDGICEMIHWAKIGVK